MKREYYLRGRRRTSKAGGNRRGRHPVLQSWLKYTGLFLLALAIGLITWQVLLSYQASQGLHRFEQAWKNKAFLQAAAAYAELKAKKSVSSPVKHAELTANDVALQRVEEKLQQYVQEMLTAWQKNRSRAFTADEVKFLKAFQDTQSRPVQLEFKKVTQEILQGKQKAEEVLPIIKQLQGISSLTAQVEQSQEVWPLLDRFAKDYAQRLAEGDYLQSVHLLKGLRQALEDKTDADLRRFLDREWKASQASLLKELQTGITEALQLRRYYTARRLWEDGEPLFAEQQSWQTLREQVQQVSLPDLVAYTGPIYGLRFHSLLRFPEIAMASGQRKYYMQNTLPQESFQSILASLYQKNYVLVDPARLVDKQGRAKPLLLPPDKKPVYLVFEDLDYSGDRPLQGGFSKLLWQDGRLQTQAFQNGQVVQEPDGDLTGYLKRFVEAHPDFSFDGGMAVLAIEGRKPLFGHVWNSRQLRAVNAELAIAQKPLLEMNEETLARQKEYIRAVITALRQAGFSFAGRGYQVEQFKDLSAEELKQDIQLWSEALGDLLPPTEIYDFMSEGLPGLEDLKLKQLYQNGYHVYLQAGGTEAFIRENQPLVLRHEQVDPLILYRKKLEAFVDSNQAYRGVIHAKMYDKKKVKISGKKRR